MRTSCISWLPDEPLILIRRSQLRLCDGDHCAAALMSFFEYWHNVKLSHQQQAEQANRVARQHKEEETQDTSLLQFHTENDLEEGMLDLYGRKTIRIGLGVLIKKGFVSIHKNPNKRYSFDHTRYFLFHPEVVIAQLADLPDEVKTPERENEKEAVYIDSNSSQAIDISDEVKIPEREGHFTSSSGKNTSSSGKNTSTIPEITPRDLIPSVSTIVLTSPQGDAYTQNGQGRGGETGMAAKGTVAGGGRVVTAKAQHILAYMNKVHGRQLENTTQIEKLLKSKDFATPVTIEDCKLVIDWLQAVERKRDPEAYSRYVNNITPFVPKNFDRHRDKARQWQAEGCRPFGSTRPKHDLVV